MNKHSSPKHASAQGNGSNQQSAPQLVKHTKEVQKFAGIVPLSIGLSPEVCAESVKNLNEILANTITLRDLYKKHHWQVVGHTFYQLHLLFDKHYQEQADAVDKLAERIQMLGGISVAMANEVSELTTIEAPPPDREDVPTQITRLLSAHELIIKQVRKAAKKADERDDLGSNDLLVTDVLRLNELQVWFLAEHLVGLAVVRSERGTDSPVS